jgi:hypothetical protein
VKVHGGFLATSRHALPTMLEVIKEALDQARTELRQSEPAAAPAPAAAAPAAANGTAGEAAGDATSAPAAAAAGAAPNAEAEPKLYLLGHSRGGGLATVMAAQLSSAHFQEAGRFIAGIYTFGAPKVGNKKFVQSYGKRLGQVTYAW